MKHLTVGAIAIAVRREAPSPERELWTGSRDSLGNFACIGVPVKIGQKGSYTAVLTAKGVKTRVVSMPSWELFDMQDAAYRESVLPSDVRARVACEAGIEMGWQKYLGDRGRFVGMASFGASAPAGNRPDRSRSPNSRATSCG